MTQTEALNYFREHSGYARMKDLKDKGIHPRIIRNFLVSGIVQKIKPGVYKLRDFESSEHQAYVDLCVAIPKAVVSLGSALNYFGLLPEKPEFPTIAVPQGYRIPAVAWPEFRSYFFSGHMYSDDIEEIDTGSGSFRVYSREKSIVDLIRFRHKHGLDKVREVLRNYARSNLRHLGKLLLLSKECRVYNVILPILDDVMEFTQC